MSPEEKEKLIQRVEALFPLPPYAPLSPEKEKIVTEQLMTPKGKAMLRKAMGFDRPFGEVINWLAKKLHLISRMLRANIKAIK